MGSKSDLPTMTKSSEVLRELEIPHEIKIISAHRTTKLMYEFNKRVFGFKYEGTLKERDFVDGKYVDRLILALLRKDWLNETR